MRKLLCCVTIVKLQMVRDLNQALFGLAEFYSIESVCSAGEKVAVLIQGRETGLQLSYKLNEVA